MTVWILYNYDGVVDGVFTATAKAKKDEQLFGEALSRRALNNDRITKEILELRELRKPYITEAELLLDAERTAKEAGDGVRLKAIRKQRKVLLKQADHLTYDIKRREDVLLAAQRMTRAEILDRYSTEYYWEEYDINE